MATTSAPLQAQEAGKLAPRFEEFLEIADPLFDKKTKRAWNKLDEDFERDEFIVAFWKSLDPSPGTSRNEFRELWLARWEEARERWDDPILLEPRAVAYLNQGDPASKREDPCFSLLWPVEVWVWPDADRFGRVVAVFVDTGRTGRYRLWTALDDPQWLAENPLQILPLSDLERLEAVRRWLEGGREGRPGGTPVGGPSRPGLPGGPDSPGLGTFPGEVPQGRPGQATAFGLSDIDDVSPTPERLFGLFEMMMNSCRGEVDFAHLLLEAVAQQRVKPFATELMTAASPDVRRGENQKEWLDDWESRSTDLRGTGEPLPAELEFSFPGRRLSQTIVEGTFMVPIAEASEVEQPEIAYRFEVNGQVLRQSPAGDGELVQHEDFRYRFEIPTTEIPGDTAEFQLPLVFRRYLRPGQYSLRVRLKDVTSGRQMRVERDLDVPRREAEEEITSAEIKDVEKARADLVAGGVRITLERPTAEVLTGYQRFTAEVGGEGEGQVAKVGFELDGAETLRRSRAPWSVELALGAVPRPHVVEAVAYDQSGAEIARDRLEVNQGKRRFSVRVIEPESGMTVSGALNLRALVAVPEGPTRGGESRASGDDPENGEPTLDRVEIYRDDSLLATLYQEPFEHRLTLGNEATLLRVVAYLDDGNLTEDAVLVNVPGETERLRIHLVEMALRAESGGRPVRDLSRHEITIQDAAETHEPLRLEQTEDLPLHLSVLLDTSGSMQDRLDEMRTVALKFFEDAVRPKDRVSVVTFHERPQLRVDFTSDLEEMRKGLRYLSAGQGTAFYDAVLYALYQFRGMRGQRALLLLTDGKDVDSQTTWEETLEFARRSGVTIFPIGLKGLKRSPQAASLIEQLARETGGRSWFVKDVAELDGVYGEIIAELRSRYLVTWQVTVGEDEGFRPVTLRVLRDGVRVTAPAGYYP